MPELPEVETLRRHLIALEGDRLERVVCPGPKVLVHPERIPLLEKRTLFALLRHGKHLLWHLDGNLLLDLHLGMSGHLSWTPSPHTRFSLHWSAHPSLHFNDPRMFGRIRIWTEPSQATIHLGPDALSPPDLLEELLENPSRRALKAALLDQSLLAGLGNIYVDEALFLAQLHPTRSLCSLSRSERRALSLAIASCLQRGLEHGGTTLRDYRSPEGEAGSHQNVLNVYGRTGLPCPLCREAVSRMIVAGRGTHFCPRCQPALPS